MQFNQSKPNIFCLDINSCFATIEQQANPLLRNKPVAVCAYTTNTGTILAASVDAKKLGIKTGMLVKDAKAIYPGIKILAPDPPKYRFVHRKIKAILKKYSDNVVPKSIDEFVFNLFKEGDAKEIAKEIKREIEEKVGEYITVSIGISTNRYLAKVASNLQKPDGLVEINNLNVNEVFSKMKLTDLTGIKKGNSRRLNVYGIKTVKDFYNSPVWKLKLAFGGIGGLYWHTRLHGFEVDDFKSTRKTYGNSYSIPLNKVHLKLEILSKLCQKTGLRLRSDNKVANGVHLFISFREGGSWHKGRKTKGAVFENGDIYKEALDLMSECPVGFTPRVIAVSVFGLEEDKNLQLNMFNNEIKKSSLVKATDSVNKKYGEYTLHTARLVSIKDLIKDRIAFGH